MDKDKKKRLAKEARKAAGIAGASAAIGASVLAPDDIVWGAEEYLGRDYSPLNRFIGDKVFGDGGLIDKVAENSDVGVGINAAASGIGGLAAYGLLRGGIKGLKKLDDNRLQKKAALFTNIKVNNS